ncbi:replication protein [Pseudomonas sp. NPDC087358]|uniref:replication protein n=1 Tax=Pseudomonas sp. NPDC087358 TaxID=3364439 RepID=UPI00384FE075
MSNVIPLKSTGGFTRMDNKLIEALMVVDLPGRELKVALYVARATVGFHVPEARIQATEISKATNIHPDVASKAISHLLKRRILYRVGGARGDIGISEPAEWIYYDTKKECPNQTISSDSDRTGCVVSIARQTKSDDSLLYTKKEPLLTLPTEEINAPRGAEHTPIEASPLVSFDGEDFKVDTTLINKWSVAYAPIDVESEIKRAAAWASANRPKKDWRRFLVKWLGNQLKRNPQGTSEVGVPVDQIIALYHRICPNLAPVTVASDRVLRSMIAERWNESTAHQSGQGFWLGFFQKANNRSQVFFRGANVTPRLEALVSRAVFREVSEAAQ